MNYYLNRYAFREKIIDDEVDSKIGIVVVIPCYNEPNLVRSLQGLANCLKPTCKVEVIVVINASEKAEELVLNQNSKSYNEALTWVEDKQSEHFKFYFIKENGLPKKHAGVGLARKIGMDEAVRRFDKINNHKGIIACFDADAICDTNYFVELEKHFNKNPKSPACSIHFEHPISGDDFSEAIYNGIMQYELHLRYYKNGLDFANLPYAFHTIGSSMAVRSDAYQKQNGMNKRKAGEDFYFLQKLIPLGNFTELKTTKIIPSPRVSDRVPFGTGKAMQNWLDEAGNSKKSLLSSQKTEKKYTVKKERSISKFTDLRVQELLSYNPKSFIDLKLFTEAVPKLYGGINNIPETIQAFLDTIDFEENIINIKKNSKTESHFTEVFFKWFNAFKVLKYMHFARDNYYPDLAIYDGANVLLEMASYKKENNLKHLLKKYRAIDCT